jgi:hypothetical protein
MTAASTIAAARATDRVDILGVSIGAITRDDATATPEHCIDSTAASRRGARLRVIHNAAANVSDPSGAFGQLVRREGRPLQSRHCEDAKARATAELHA